MINTLKVKKVVIFDFQEPYSQGLAARSRRYLKKHGRHHDPSLGSEHDDRLLVVRDEGSERHRRRLLPDAAAAGEPRRSREQLVEQGKKAILFGGDGSNAPA